MRPGAKRLSVAAGLFVLAASAAAGSALAHHDDHGWKHRHHHKHDFGPAGHVHYYYAAPPVVFVPRPVIYREEPRYFGPPAPSLNINIPLR
jgi:hypothetical protein